MKALTFGEIRNIVRSICEGVDTNYDDTTDVQDAIAESCHEYFIYHGDVWAAAAGMRFEYYDAWFEAEQNTFDYMPTDTDIDRRLFVIVHECLLLLVEAQMAEWVEELDAIEETEA
jgi:hypothetical protein